MAYRPQFAIPGPCEGFTYQEFIYPFDGFNVPTLASLTLAPGQEILHIPLKLDEDADFLWLGTKIDGTELGILFETPWTEPLSDGYAPAKQLAGNIVPTPVESGVFCPAGSVISLSLKNLS